MVRLGAQHYDTSRTPRIAQSEVATTSPRLTDAEATDTWEAAIQRLIDAAADTAEFAEGFPTGRSRQVSIRKLASAIDELRATESRLTEHLPTTHPRTA
jgi:hypothetical protein